MEDGENTMTQQLSVIDSLVKLEKKFDGQNSFDLTFANECLFARQLITKNDFSMKTAQNNPQSLQSAVLNVAAIGVSLNPANAHAYLVPRGGAICLDISYKGLVKLATDSGAILWAKSELVYEGDTFEWVGMTELPVHTFDPFNEKRVNIADPMENLRGGYCVAQLASGGYLIDRMSAAEILKVKATSKASSGPWKTWPEEMMKKTLVKRAAKSWPQSGGRNRLDKAIDVLNEHEGLEEIKVIQTSEYLKPSPEQTAKYLELAKGDPVDFWLWYSSQDQAIQTSLPGCEFEQGKKTATMKHFNGLIEAGRASMEEWNINLISVIESDDEVGAAEILNELPTNQREALIETLGVQHIRFAQEIAA